MFPWTIITFLAVTVEVVPAVFIRVWRELRPLLLIVLLCCLLTLSHCVNAITTTGPVDVGPVSSYDEAANIRIILDSVGDSHRPVSNVLDGPGFVQIIRHKLVNTPVLRCLYVCEGSLVV